MDSEHKMVSLNIFCICAAITIIIVSAVLYEDHKNVLIDKATTCEGKIIINGSDSDLVLKQQILACRGVSTN